MKNQSCFLESPIGLLKIEGNAHVVTSISFQDEGEKEEGFDKVYTVLYRCQKQLDEYFKGERLVFDFKFGQIGTAFQHQVWEALTKIPYGEKSTYKAIAESLDNPKAVRAVGMANGQNRLAVVVPCHRIIGSDGKLTGYAGGLWRKKWLLEHEARTRGKGQLSLF